MLSQSALRAAWAPPCRGPLVRVPLYGNGVVSVRAQIVEAVRALDTVARVFGYQTRRADTGAYNCRPVTGGSRYSMHAYGTALDRNWQSNPYGTHRTDRPPAMNKALVRIRTNDHAQVWNWGGYWSHPDPMHDEIVCSPQNLASGIDYSTVFGGGAPIPPPPPPPSSPPPAPPPAPPPTTIGVIEMLIAVNTYGYFAVVNGVPQGLNPAEFAAARKNSIGVQMLWLDRGPGEALIQNLLRKHAAIVG